MSRGSRQSPHFGSLALRRLVPLSRGRPADVVDRRTRRAAGRRTPGAPHRDRVLADARSSSPMGAASRRSRSVGSPNSSASKAMSLYYHVANKGRSSTASSTSCSLRSSRSAAASRSPSRMTGGRAALRARILGARRVMLRHPWAPGVMETRAAIGPTQARVRRLGRRHPALGRVLVRPHPPLDARARQPHVRVHAGARRSTTTAERSDDLATARRITCRTSPACSRSSRTTIPSRPSDGATTSSSSSSASTSSSTGSTGAAARGGERGLTRCRWLTDARARRRSRPRLVR